MPIDDGWTKLDEDKRITENWTKLVEMVFNSKDLNIKEMQDDFFDIVSNPDHPQREFFLNHLEEWIMLYVL